MGLLLLIALQLAVTVAGFALLWRRLDRISGEVTRLQSLLDLKAKANTAATHQRRVAGAPAEAAAITTTIAAPLERAARAWRLPERSINLGARGPTLSPETGRGLALAVLATAPAIGFFFNIDPSAIVASGLAIGAAMMLVALRPMWRAAAWASVITAGTWALLGFALAAAHAEPFSYSACVALAAGAGLAHAHLRRAIPGATMALTMSAAVLALGSQIGMVSAAGLSFGAIVVMAAIIGARTLRLEPMHLAAFASAVIGLFVLSGQDDAAIWFTPAATWAGALFLAIAAVRVPQLGARGVALAGTGAFAPLGVIAALHASHAGLANSYAAAAAFVVLAIMLGVIIGIAAMRRDRGLAALRITLWLLALGAFLAISSAIFLALPAPIAAPAFAGFALALLALDHRFSDAAWRTFAVFAGVLSALNAGLSAEMLLDERAQWAPATLVLLGLSIPAFIGGGSAYLSARNKAFATSGLFEILVLVLAVASANLLTRLLFTGGATLLQPIGFVETGVHSVVWLIAALLIGSRADLGVRGVRVAAINVLSLMALAAMTVASILWLASYWKTHADAAAPSFLSRDTMGFVLPATFFWAHWVFWRARGASLQTRLSLGAGALLLAAFITIEAVRAESIPQWLSAMICAVSFALAIVINFAPGVTNTSLPAKSRGRSPSRPARRATP
jgi:hypothetical protein